MSRSPSPRATSEAAERRPVNTDGSISKVPCEVLTHILSYLPSHINDVRLVCRGFNDCAWPAFGARLGDTKFEMRSITSMKNLKAIADYIALTPYINSLCFITGWIHPEFPGEQLSADAIHDSEDEDYDEFATWADPSDYLSDELFDRLMCYNHHTYVWFPDAWRWVPCYSHLHGTLEEYAVSTQKRAVIDFLSQTLSKLTNLKALRYEPDHLPQNFESLHQDILENVEDTCIDFEPPEGPQQEAINRLGVEIILQALAAGDIAVKDLSIQVPSMTFHGLVTYSTPDVIKRVLSSVERLHIKMTGYADSHHLVKNNEVELSIENAPNLSYLEWNGWLPFAAQQPSLVPGPSWIFHQAPSSPLPPIRHLNLLHMSARARSFHAGTVFHDCFFGFLTRIGGTLRIFEIKIHVTLKWEGLLKFLATSSEVSLESLHIGFDGINQSLSLDYYLTHAGVPKKELVYQSAQKVTIEPEEFRTWLEKKWDPPQAKKSKATSKKIKSKRQLPV